MGMAILFPILAVVTIIVYAGGLGVTFILINETPVEELGVLVLGMALVVGVPTIAALVEHRLDRD